MFTTLQEVFFFFFLNANCIQIQCRTLLFQPNKVKTDWDRNNTFEERRSRCWKMKLNTALQGAFKSVSPLFVQVTLLKKVAWLLLFFYFFILHSYIKHMIEVITKRNINIRITSNVLHLLTDETVLDFMTSINWGIKFKKFLRCLSFYVLTWVTFISNII